MSGAGLLWGWEPMICQGSLGHAGMPLFRRTAGQNQCTRRRRASSGSSDSPPDYVLPCLFAT